MEFIKKENPLSNNFTTFDHDLAAKAERLGQLPIEWLEIVYQENWFKMFVPKDLEGLELTLPQALKLEEKLVKLDGSLGWTITLCAGAGWFVGFLEEELRKEVFADPKVCLAGSGFIGGKANRVGDIYEISGNWTYASGALHATHFTANCELLENGNPMFEKKGNRIVKAFILKREEVEILDGWSYMGMIATGSHCFKTENLKVPLNRSFEILPEKATLSGPVYHYPFLQFAEVTLTANILGITQHLIELIEKAFWTRNEYRSYSRRHLDYFERVFNKQTKELMALRKEFFLEVKSSWKELQKSGKISKTSLKKVSRISRKLTQTCRQISGRLYPFSGLEAAKTHTELNRVWRDFNTVTQHALLIFPF